MDEAILVVTSLNQEAAMGQTPSKQQPANPASDAQQAAAVNETLSNVKEEPLTPSKMTRSQTLEQQKLIAEQIIGAETLQNLILEQSPCKVHVTRLEHEKISVKQEDQGDSNSQQNLNILEQSPCAVHIPRWDLNTVLENSSLKQEDQDVEKKIHITRQAVAEQKKAQALSSPCKEPKLYNIDEKTNSELTYSPAEPKIKQTIINVEYNTSLEQQKLNSNSSKIIMDHITTSGDQSLRSAKQKLNFGEPKISMEQERFPFDCPKIILEHDKIISEQQKLQFESKTILFPQVQVMRLDSPVKQKKEFLEQARLIQGQSSPCSVQMTRLDLLQHAAAATTTQQQLMEQELESDRSDGSDSGLGSDAIERDLSVILQQQQLSTSSSTTAVIPRGALKRPASSSCDPGQELEQGVSQTKRARRAVAFDAVTVYYFPRAQGFCCVPSQGGSTLGMSARHFSLRRYTIAEHCMEQRRAALRRARRSAAAAQRRRDNNDTSNSDDDDDDDDESSSDECDDENDSDSENANQTTEIEVEEEQDEPLPCLVDDPPSPVASSGVLLPVPARQRRALLRASGVRKIDAAEREECRTVRQSREFCGCECRGFCDPETCACSRAGVKCQVDRPGFPCGCYKDGCANIAGRAEFNPNRVRTHFIHTLMRLDLEEKQRATELRNTQLSNHQSQNMLYGNMGSTGSYYHTGGTSVSTPAYPDLFAPYGDYGYEGYVYPTYEDPPPINEIQPQQQHRIQTPASISSSNEAQQDENNRSITVDAATCEENFAEIIKNSMVDTVSA